MSRLLLAVCAVAALALLAAVPVASVSIMSEFDSTVDDFGTFTELLEIQQANEADTNEHLTEEELALLEVHSENGENPSYTLAYPPVTYASHAAGGFIHPYSNVNPLAAPWSGFAPVAAPVHAISGAAIAATPLSAFFAGGLHPHGLSTALGINTALYPAAYAGLAADAKGGYNVHGINAGNVFGGFHPGLSADLTSLGGKAGTDAGSPSPVMFESASASEMGAEAESAAEVDLDADIEAALDSDSDASTEVVDAAFDGLDAVADAEMDVDLLEVAQEPEAEAEAPAEEAPAEAPAEEGGAAPAADAAGGGGSNPSYTLPYPPVLPGHYTPLFNPYTNVNPLSTPFANYAATPGAHPGVAAAAAAQAGGLAAINGQIAGAQGGYPYYPYNAGVGHGFVGGFGAAGVPFSGYAGWIHPQNLNSAAVGENAEAASLGQFIEVATEEVDHGDVCVGCEY